MDYLSIYKNGLFFKCVRYVVIFNGVRGIKL